MTQPAAVAIRSPLAAPRVVFYDPIPGDWSYAIERSVLEAQGVELVIPGDETAAEQLIEDADIVVVTGIGRLRAAQIGRLRRAVGLLCYSIGMDQVDGAAAATAGIPVRNVPGYCADEVADHALTLLLAAWRRLIPIVDGATRAGWPMTQAGPDVQAIRRIRGKTLGILGAGRIGTRVGIRARAFGMRTIAADPWSSGSEDLPVLPLVDVLAQADGLVCCAALTPESRDVLDASALARVKPGLVLVNVARGGLVDETALAAALADGRIAYAALDVRDPEPPDATRDPLAGVTNILLTPHIGASSREAVEDLHREAAETCLEILRAAGRLDPIID